MTTSRKALGVLRHAQRRLRVSMGAPRAAQPPVPCFYGVTRFSVFQPKAIAWKLSMKKAGQSDYRRRLYAPERMRPRCDIFLGMSVPMLQQMADRYDYRHIVHFTPDMPEPWLGELLAAAERHPVLMLHPSDSPQQLQEVITEHLRATVSPKRTVVQFRVDDDDLLAASYLDQLSQFTTPVDRGRAVSLATGYTARLDPTGLGPVYHVRRPLGAQGQAYVGHYDPESDSLHLQAGGNHSSIDRRMPTVLDSRRPAYFQIRHSSQDTLTDAAAAASVIDRALAKLSPVEDVEAVLAEFPTLAKVLPPGPATAEPAADRSQPTEEPR